MQYGARHLKRAIERYLTCPWPVCSRRTGGHGRLDFNSTGTARERPQLLERERWNSVVSKFAGADVTAQAV